MILRADQHYRVGRSGADHVITKLICLGCGFTVMRGEFQQPKGSKSGVGRYNLMRARMVKHIHADHAADLRQPLAAGVYHPKE